ncbi:MAG: DUF493 family protein [Flavobacteriales bacterium]|nr:DUF493 family protein [Flavobacteriales bacterium]
MDKERLERLRAHLDETHTWPAVFMFKFVLPKEEEKVTQLKLIFGQSAEFKERLSRKGNYISVTIQEMMLNADAIFDRYLEASKIEGIIAL